MNGQVMHHPVGGNDENTDHFQSYLREIRPLVNDRIAEVTDNVEFDGDILPFLVRGKRLRAGLLLFVCEILCDMPEKRGSQALDLACALELAHAASLIVDDMIDEDSERRGLTTVHLTQGQKTAMLDAIGILSLTYSLVAPYHSEYVLTLAKIQREMTLGVVQELLPSSGISPLVRYESIITKKTGYLFGLAAEWGFLVAQESGSGRLQSGDRGKGTPLRRLWRDYGIHVGRSMQIADDIVDLKKKIYGGITGNPGSEMLLLEAAYTSDGGELLTSRDAGNLEISDASHIIPSAFLNEILIREEEKAHKAFVQIEELRSLPEGGTFCSASDRRATLRTLGHAIAQIVLGEEKITRK